MPNFLNTMNNLRRHISTGNVISSMFKIPVDNYLTIEALEDGLTVSLSSNACEYCIDGDGEWKSLSAGAKTQSIGNGHTLSFRGTLTPTSSNGIGTFTISKQCNLKGNCMSMLYEDDAINNNSVASYAFQGLFQNAATIINASELQIPATSLNTYCYRNMFQGCSNLVYPPKTLPAKTVKSYSYYQMFAGCNSLVEAPKISATTLASYCYQYMFSGCSKLKTVYDLPGKVCQTYCYAYMFQNCTSLVNPPKINATILSTYCYYYMFKGCTKLVTAPELPVTELKNYCYKYMFYGCSKLTMAPELPATTLTNDCYQYMFWGCSSLMTAPELLAPILTSSCYSYMFYNCTKLNYIKMLAVDISADSCLRNWVNNVASTGTFVKHPDMTTLPTSTSGIPSGWTVEDYVEKNLITFTIAGVEYQAEEGMTWGEWVESEYNIHNYSIFNDYICNNSLLKCVTVDSVYCTSNDVIISSKNYIMSIFDF